MWLGYRRYHNEFTEFGSMQWVQRRPASCLDILEVDARFLQQSLDDSMICEVDFRIGGLRSRPMDSVTDVNRRGSAWLSVSRVLQRDERLQRVTLKL